MTRLAENRTHYALHFNVILKLNYSNLIFLGRCLGVMLGCLLGMFPLLFITTTETKETDTKDDELPNAEIEKVDE